MKNIICSTFGHELVVSKCVTKHISEYKCKRCKNEFTVDGKGQIVKHTEKHREINRVLEKMYKTKLKKYQEIPQY
ncbi:MAG: hypothetical protein R2802_07280 [Flavobacteriaceae bacterium]|nr:hypothetical protein [Mangrovimonas sp.]MCB0426878.1 hypothetical protein [Mangrovimonas sp.]MCB0433084.1 hypothetical protein [Mangrovimonas sp.]MCB0439416.1 hypothetical protein [Mangrovimonas sp.]HPF97365.1 hypothetical protein [Mangrovimonas sp.]